MAYVQGFNFFTQSCHSARFHGFREYKLSKRLMSEGNLYVDKEKGDEKKKKLKILIAGGGIAGLVLALAAKKNGFEVKVFEKDLSAVRGEGRDRGPIQLSSSALGLLESIDKDVARDITEAGYVTGDRCNGLADGITGEWFVKYDLLTPAVEKRIPVTQIICRIELQRLLLNAVGNDTVINNSKVVDFISDHDKPSTVGLTNFSAIKVTVFLQNGQKHEGDILVGADGIRSMVCRMPNYVAFHQNTPRLVVLVHLNVTGALETICPQQPKYSNFMYYTGVAEFHDPHFGCKIFLGTNQYFVIVDIGNGRMQWYAFLRRARENADVPSTGNKKMLVECFGDWCNEVNMIISRTTEHMIKRRPIHDIDITNTWGRGRVILLGDAAHAMLPNLGQGGCMAIDDCYWLMVELQNLAERHPLSEIPLNHLELAFKRFEKKRMYRVRTVHSVCRVASITTSFYQTYLDIGPLPLFNLTTMRLEHPIFVVSSKLMQLALPKFMDWVVMGQE